MMQNKGNKTTAIILCAVVIAIVAWTGIQFRSMFKPDEIHPADGFETHMLSEWETSLKGTNADTPVYIQNGAEPGGTVYVEGGIHANEPAGMLAAVLIAERAHVAKGRLIVVPFTNMSALTNNFPQDGVPQSFKIEQEDGKSRLFRFGSRATNPIDQWPDPTIYIHMPSGQEFDGASKRNMNRAFPGSSKGEITLRAANAITVLLRDEKVDLAFDLHEAAPEYPVIDTMVVNENAMELGVIATMGMMDKGIEMGVEPSPKNFRGLTHREWNETSPNLMVVLMETCNPSQGRLRGCTDEELIVTGKDKAYAKAAKLGRLYAHYVDSQPIELRVARHIAGVTACVEALETVDESKTAIIENIPSYHQLVNEGVGKWLAVGTETK